MTDFRQVFDMMMSENSAEEDPSSLEDDLFQQEIEGSMINEAAEAALTKDQTEMIDFCRAVVNSATPPPSELGLLVRLRRFTEALEARYPDRTIFYFLDIIKRASDCKHTLKTGPGEVTCKLTTQSIKLPDCAAISLVIASPEVAGTKTFHVQKQLLPLIYSLFFVVRFEDCVKQKLKKEPNCTNAEFLPLFSKLEQSMRYIEYHLPA